MNTIISDPFDSISAPFDSPLIQSPILERLGLDSAQRQRRMTKAKALLKRA
ncbi:MAG: hypothetical protein ACW7DQ_15870 [Paraglaciecola chathamensis]